MAAAFASEHPTPGANNSNNYQAPYNSLQANQMINNHAVLGGDYRTPGVNNSNDHQRPHEPYVANAMIEMAPTDSSQALVVGERSSHQKSSELRRFHTKVVCILVACLLVLIGFGVFFGLMWILRTPKEEGSSSSSLDVTSSAFPTSTEATTTTEVVFSDRSFKFLTSLQSNEGLNSAFYRADGNILVGTTGGVKLVDREHMIFTSFNTSFTSVTSIIEHHNVTYVLHVDGNIGKVESCSRNLNNCQTLFTFAKPLYYVPKMAVSSWYIVVHDGDRKLIIYDLFTKYKKIKQTRDIRSPYFLPDGHLLAHADPTVSKYRMEAGEPIKLWTCDGLEDTFNVVADAAGYIYALTGRSRRIVYVISPDGELLRTVHNGQLPMIPRQASIRGNEMAVPEGGDNYLYLFKIS